MNLSVLIVTHNSRDHVVRCLTSLSPVLERLASEVVVVDNGSSDRTVQLVQQAFPSVRVVALGENRGFAAGINRGLAVTSGKYVMWLNPDAAYLGGRLEDVLEWMAAHPRVGIVGGRVVDPDGSVQRSARTFPSYGAVLGARHALLTKLWPGNRFSRDFLRSNASDAAIEPVDWISGAFVIHTREIAERLGGLDEGFFMYFEDVDFCYRAWRAGSRVYVHPGATVEHDVAGGSSRAPIARLVARHRSLWRWYAKHFRRFWIKDALVWTGIWIRCGALIGAAVIFRRPSNA